MTTITPVQTEKILRSYVNMPDSQIRAMAKQDAAQGYEDSKARKFGNFAFKSVPFVDSIAAGLLAGTAIYRNKSGKSVIKRVPTTLYKKLRTTTKTAALWAGALGILAGLRAINNKLTAKKLVQDEEGNLQAKSNKYAEFRENNRGLTFFGDIAILLAAWGGAANGAKALANSKVVKNSKFIKHIKLGVHKLGKSINRSLVSQINDKHITPFFNKIAKKNIKFAKNTLPGLIASSAFIAIGVGLISKTIANVKYNKQQHETYAQLKNAQLMSAQALLEKTDNIF